MSQTQYVCPTCRMKLIERKAGLWCSRCRTWLAWFIDPRDGGAHLLPWRPKL